MAFRAPGRAAAQPGKAGSSKCMAVGQGLARGQPADEKSPNFRGLFS
jgi:hypothetical protein